MRILNKLLKIGFSLVLLGLLTVALTYAYIYDELPSVDTLKDVQLQTPMKIYTAEGLLISQYGEKRRIPLRLSQIPQPLIDAILATEDNRFYQHPGIDIIGIIRSVIAVATTGTLKQGASTITMQLARNFYLTREKTLMRKIKELFISLHIEGLLSKDEILELYLNKIALGHRSFGVGAAAQVYYGKDINQLSLAEMATIAGLPKAPSSLNPISHPQRAKKRRAVVLGRMLATKYITQAEFEQAKNQPVTASKHGADIEAKAPYVASLANEEMIRRYGLEDAYTGGYKVYTTVPAKLQYAAQQAVVNNLHAYDERHGYRGPEKYLWEQPEPPEAPNLSEQEAAEELIAAEEAPAIIINENAWDNQQIDQHLKDTKIYGPLTQAVVTGITEKTANIRLSNGVDATLSWDNLKWARPFINDNRSGRRVKKTVDIFNDGALIWVRQMPTGLYRLAQVPGPSGALVALNPNNGAIRSIVGGYSYELSQYNRATQAKRQVGSNIKPLIYSAALEHGRTLASLINDAPIHQWDEQLGVAWRPKNSPPQYDGPIRIRVALAKSKNVVSVRLLKSVGLGNVVDHIEKFGIPREEIPQNDSLALGSASLTPLQVAASIATFANGGFLIEPFLIDRIENVDGDVVFKANPVVACETCEGELSDSSLGRGASGGDVASAATSQSNEVLTPVIPASRIISSQNAFLVSQAMTSTIWGGGDWNNNTGWNGTGFRAQKLKRRDLSGKTGTTNDAKDTWFSGFNNQLMVTTWVGFDNPSRALGRVPAGSEAGARTAQPPWIDYMKIALSDKKEQSLLIPEDIVSVRIDQQTGLLATKYDSSSRFEYFIKGTEPSKYAASDSTPEVVDDDGEGKVTEEDELF